MKLVYARTEYPNFGDELNLWLWPQLLPGMFDDDDDVLFLGIGSILHSGFNGPKTKIVFGPGYVPAYGGLPDIASGNWKIYFVRGPRTAATLGLDPALAVGDAAILIRAVVDPAGPRGDHVSFMPHWESLDRGCWADACAKAGVRLIDPRRPVAEVLEAIAQSRLMICEAMHGAIVADALRIPWTPILPLVRGHRSKWRDWSEALGVDYRPRILAPSSPVEMVVPLTSRPAVVQAADRLFRRPLLAPLAAVTTSVAAACLRRAARGGGTLSDEGRIGRATDTMLAKVEQLKADWRAGDLSRRFVTAREQQGFTVP